MIIDNICDRCLKEIVLDKKRIAWNQWKFGVENFKLKSKFWISTCSRMPGKYREIPPHSRPHPLRFGPVECNLVHPTLQFQLIHWCYVASRPSNVSEIASEFCPVAVFVMINLYKRFHTEFSAMNVRGFVLYNISKDSYQLFHYLSPWQGGVNCIFNGR